MEKWKEEIENFLLNQNIKAHDDDYWLNVVKGIILLFKYKEHFTDNDHYIKEFLKIREVILNNNGDPLTEDLTDELWAVLIKSYPMPNFWTASLEDFKQHDNFKPYFQMLDSKS